MWLSKELKTQRKERPIELGTATAGGRESFVYTDGERRKALILAPGGYFWRPGVGQELLVLKCQAEGEKPFLLAADPGEAPVDMQDGEVYIKSKGGVSLYLKNDGRLLIEGSVFVNGKPLEQSEE